MSSSLLERRFLRFLQPGQGLGEFDLSFAKPGLTFIEKRARGQEFAFEDGNPLGDGFETRAVGGQAGAVRNVGGAFGGLVRTCVRARKRPQPPET